MVAEPPAASRVESSPRNPGGRIVGLDALRGFAAFGVLLFHYTVIYEAYYGFKGRVGFHFGAGFFGVHLFFLISGFVVFMTVEKSGRLVDFAISRFSRLYPAYWFALGLTTSVLCLFPGPEPFPGYARLLKRAVANLPMFEGWFAVTFIDGVYWTLNVEMSFYAIMGLILWSGQLRRTVAILVALVALGAVQGLLWPRFSAPAFERFRLLLSLDYLHVLTIGVLIFKMRGKPRLVHWVLMILCLLVPFTQHRMNQEPVRDLAYTACFAAVVLLVANGRLRWLDHKALTFLGTISYSLYLTHNMIGRVVIFNLQRAGWSANASIAIATGFAIALATAMTFLVERPAMKATRRWLERRAGIEGNPNSREIVGPAETPTSSSIR